MARTKWISLASVAEITGIHSSGATFSELRKVMGKKGVRWKNGTSAKPKLCSRVEDLARLPPKFLNVRVTKDAQDSLLKYLSESKDSRF